MSTLNCKQLEEKYEGNLEFTQQFERLFTLRELLTNCLVHDNYIPPREFGESIVLSEHGNELFQELANVSAFSAEHDAKLAIFLKFFHDDLFIDVEKCNADQIQDLIDREVSGGNGIRYPWLFDRELYDKYFDLFGEPKKYLSCAETFKLLDGSSPGVFQLGKVVVGPFGLLRSECRRRLLPTRNVALWHCSDLSCQSLHGVELSTGKTSFNDISEEIKKILGKRETHASEWKSFYRELICDGQWYDDRNAADLPWLLANGFTDSELRRVLASIIDRDANVIRPLLPQTKQFKALFSASGLKIAERLSKAQCFQLLLLLSDSCLVRNIEQTIENEGIVIPSTETRNSRFSRDTTTQLDISAECSRYGIRLISDSYELGTDRLRTLVRYLYKDDIDNLKWKLRHVLGGSVYEKLDYFVHKEASPIRVLKELVFSDEEKAQLSLQFLDCQWITLPSSQAEEYLLVEKVLWKLGFDVASYPGYQKQFWDRLKVLHVSAKMCTKYNESDQESIRSAAVNCFVSVEEILDLSLSFSTWMLLSDHFAHTKYRFELSNAREFMANTFNQRQLGSQKPVIFDSQRQNTLYPMIQGFGLLADACEELLENSGKYKRHESDWPGFFRQSRLYSFPFLHTALIADIRTDDRLRILGLLRETTRSLDVAQICDMRNRLEHKRDCFPQPSEIESVCTALHDAILKLETAGLCPTVYRFAHKTCDEFGRGQYILRNYKENEFSVPFPTQFQGCKLPSGGSTQFIVPCLHIGDSFEPMRFSFVEHSEYSHRWKDYPRRIKNDADNEESEPELVTSEVHTQIVASG